MGKETKKRKKKKEKRKHSRLGKENPCETKTIEKREKKNINKKEGQKWGTQNSPKKQGKRFQKLQNF